MTKEEYVQLCVLIKRKVTLEKIKKDLSNNRYILGYVLDSEFLFLTRYDNTLSSDIRDILQKHDKMIREEINQEIDKLEKKIESL
jgi:hypothetical protein